MPKSRIQKFTKHGQLGEVSDYTYTTDSQSDYLRSLEGPYTKKTVANKNPRRSPAVYKTAKLQAKINEMRANNPQTNFSSTGNDIANTTASIQEQINQLNR